jgi:hypothetical protein
MASKFLPKAREYDPEFIEVSRFAKGATIPFEEVFTLRSLLELIFFMHRIPAMCTALAVKRLVQENHGCITG